jgi:hypothetical protein
MEEVWLSLVGQAQGNPAAWLSWIKTIILQTLFPLPTQGTSLYGNCINSLSGISAGLIKIDAPPRTPAAVLLLI